MATSSSRYTQRHFQDFAALLAAERDANGPSPALNRITAAITALFAENSANFNRELFGKAARGRVSPTARPRKRGKTLEPHDHEFGGQKLTHAHAGGHLPHGYYEHPEDMPSDRSESLGGGWTPPVIATLREDQS